MAVRFLVITDHHLGRRASSLNRGYATAWALERLLEAIAAANMHGADFLLCTGDLVDEGLDEEYLFARELLGFEANGRAPGPLRLERTGLEGLNLFVVPGNHDPRLVWQRNLFPASPPAGRVDLEWRVDGQDFVYLDLGTSGRAGELHEDSLDFLDSVLDRGSRPVLVLHHHPIEVGIPWLDRALPERIGRLWERVAGGSIKAVLFGHAHASVDRRVHGVPVLGTRSTCFQFARTDEPTFLIQPLHYRLVTIDDDRVTSRLYEVPLTGNAIGTPVR